jgi:hypothetical protein
LYIIPFDPGQLALDGVGRIGEKEGGIGVGEEEGCEGRKRQRES